MNDSINVREQKNMNIPDHPWDKATWIVEEAQGLKRRYVKFPTPPRPQDPNYVLVLVLGKRKHFPHGQFSHGIFW